MTYLQTINFLFNQLPVFQHIGGSAYKPGLDNTIAIDQYLHAPHTHYKTIHVAGTNGKGSTSHLLAAILQSAGYKVGLYTSPHLIDFRERIRVNGVMIDESYVVDFVAKTGEIISRIHPSFFELTMCMAFDYFAAQKVDIAIVEVGMGGRLDSTNIISPILSIITNISYDHMQFLGNTLPLIAQEKAGIIKSGIPIIIGEAEGEVKAVFEKKAAEVDAPLYFTNNSGISASMLACGGCEFTMQDYAPIRGELGGLYQQINGITILTAIRLLIESGISIPQEAIYKGFALVCSLTGLQGRWQHISYSPMVICDTGHNKAGIEYVVKQLLMENKKQLRIVLGMVNDKDVNAVLELLPHSALYYFTQPSVTRALPVVELCKKAEERGFKCKGFDRVPDAYQAALNDSDSEDLVFVGGSNFVVADFLSYIATIK